MVAGRELKISTRRVIQNANGLQKTQIEKKKIANYKKVTYNNYVKDK